MIDPTAALRFWLLDPTGPVIALLGTPTQSIFVGSLPEKYDPRQTGAGRAIVIQGGGSGLSSGGTAETELPLIRPRLRTTSWAGENESEGARAIDCAIHDWIHSKNNIDLGDFGFVLSCEHAILGQDVKDPQTKFATVVSYWHLIMWEN